jgi:predicted site-specific integrase-resolvase
VNLKEWAASQGISYATARRWYESGKLPVPAYQAGRLIVIGEPSPSVAAGITVVYARVSSADQKPDLDRQVSRVTAWATGQGLTVGRVVTEVGSALNGHRRKFLALLRDPSVTVIAVEHRDRFARFGAEYVEAALSAQGRRLAVADPSEADDDLVGDVTEILTSLCARLYGQRAAGNRAARAIAALGQDGPA